MNASTIMDRLYHARRVLLDPIAWHISRRALHRTFSASDPQSIVRASFEYEGRGFYAHIKAMQDEREFLDFVKRIEQLQPRVIVEIGTRSGGTLFAWVREPGSGARDQHRLAGRPLWWRVR